MAGGMRPGANALTLAQRSALSGVAQEVAPRPRSPSSTATHRRHCWVAGPDADPGPWPGLVLGWQRSGDGWQAWVVYLVGDDLDVAVQGWVGADRLSPAQ
jgi:hypothetical protein